MINTSCQVSRKRKCPAGMDEPVTTKNPDREVAPEPLLNTICVLSVLTCVCGPS